MKEAKSKTFKNRRYYLHGKLKGLVRSDFRNKVMFSESELERELIMSNKYAKELINNFGYIVQLEIPS